MHAIVVISAFLNVATTSFFTIYYHVDVVTPKKGSQRNEIYGSCLFTFSRTSYAVNFFSSFNSAGCDVFLLSCSLVLSSFFSFGAV